MEKARRRLRLAGGLCALLLGALASASGAATSRLVVVLYPLNSDGSPGNHQVDQAIRATFAAGSTQRVEIYNEYLDLSRLEEAGFQQFQAEYLRRKYAGRKIDVVIACLSSALDYALRHRSEAFPGVPIVICAVDGRELESRALPTDVIGHPIKMDVAGTLDLALRLHPSTQRVYVVAGQAKFDAECEAEARRTFAAYADRLEFVYLSGLPIDQLQTHLANLPERSLIYYLSVFRDAAGKGFFAAEALGLFAPTANAPIYGFADSYVGRGVVGGRTFSFETAGTTAAQVGLRILAGEKPDRIGILQPNPNRDTFDWRQLRRWGIRQKDLPPGSLVRHRESSFWDLYKWHVISLVSLCIVEAMIIGGLLTQRVHRRRAEQRFRQTVEAAPNGMLMVGPDGRIELANAEVERLFGYAKEELLGQAVEMLVPQRWRERHAQERRQFFTTPVARLMGVGRKLFGRRRDGSEFAVEIGLSPVHTDAGLHVLASIIDVTKRLEAEKNLLESQHELRVLTGKLIHSQETERRRIARELHDDLNQSLALLSVELDVLRRQPPASATELSRRMEELSTRVKQLSTSIHALSHELHPAKLEQLGLVAGLRSLCKELTTIHGLAIEFAHGGVPETLPLDTALCVYRVAQESLGNAIKHSGAQRVTVALNGSGDVLRLRVLDDGAGFEPRAIAGKGGLGLISMRERLRFVNGTIAIGSGPGSGTLVEVCIPMPTSVSVKEGAEEGDLQSRYAQV